jgi:hypothetical protein
MKTARCGDIRLCHHIHHRNGVNQRRILDQINQDAGVVG